jgi:hypothetical protein
MITEVGGHALGRSCQRFVNELRARTHPDGGDPRRTFGPMLIASNPDPGRFMRPCVPPAQGRHRRRGAGLLDGTAMLTECVRSCRDADVAGASDEPYAFRTGRSRRRTVGTGARRSSRYACRGRWRPVDEGRDEWQGHPRVSQGGGSMADTPAGGPAWRAVTGLPHYGPATYTGLVAA